MTRQCLSLMLALLVITGCEEPAPRRLASAPAASDTQNVYVVKTVADFDALASIHNRDLTVYVASDLRFTNKATNYPYEIRIPGCTLNVIGVGGGFNWKDFKSLWPIDDPNGVVLQATNINLYNLQLSNYQGSGAAVKLLADNVSVISCVGIDISNTLSSTVNNRVGNNRKFASVYGHGPLKRFIARDNTYTRCCTSHEAWAHVYYITADYIDINDSWADNCGSLWDLIGVSTSSIANARIGWFRGSRNVYDRNGSMMSPWIAVCSFGTSTYVVDHLFGSFAYHWIYDPDQWDPARHHTRIGTNETVNENPFVAVWNGHGYYSQEQYVKLGFTK